ncbi:MAG: TonB-dependent receptor [Prevotella sp.]|nr:TonB-dependent receptor [Prevotella sp.]
MTRKLLLLPLLAVATGVAAQDVADTTDVYYQHLNLNEVVVTGLTGETRLSHSPAPVTLITSRSLQSAAATNLIDAIARQPGVAQITTGSGISKPVIRGLGYNRIVTISDGVRQEGQQWGDEHGIEIDPHTVSSVEILKGPASLMYGSDAMAGVLLFHPARIVPLGELRASLSTEYQTNNGLFGYSLSMGGHQQGFVWNMRWSQKRAGEYKNRADGYVAGSQFREQSLNALLGLNKYWGFTHLTLGYYHLRPNIIASPAAAEEEAEGTPFQQIYHYKAVWDNSLNIGDNRLKATIGYQQNRRQEFEDDGETQELYFRLHTLSYDVRYLMDDLSGWKLATGIGGMWQRSENLGEEALIPAYSLFDVGAFVTAAHDLGPVHIEGGLRIDRRMLHGYSSYEVRGARFTDFHRNFNGFSASLGAVWQATEQLNVRLNVARGFRAPNMSELGSNGEHEGTIRYEVGNHDLKAEHSLQADLGIDFSSPYLSAQLSLFANRISNYIFTVRDRQMEVDEIAEEGLHFYRYAQGDARLLGFEATVDFHPMHELHFENTFSMVDARQLNQPRETRYLPMTPAPRWTSELKYELTHHSPSTLNRSPLTLCNTYVALGMELNLTQNHYYMADETETRTPAYALWDLTAGTDLHIRGRHVASLHLTLQNMFDRVYQNHLSRLKYLDYVSPDGRRGFSNMGRNFCIKLVVPFEM